MPETHPKQWLRTLGWAAYLGVSWTWCIGMFLPVLLLRDFGVWGYVAFAVPNVVGAAGMGWVLRTKEEAGAILEQHRGAVRAFTWVTVAFHCFWIGWMVWLLAPHDFENSIDGPNLIFGLGLVAGVLIIGWLTLTKWQGGAAAVLWVLSICLGAAALRTGWADTLHGGANLYRTAAPVSIFALAPVCVFGFMLCPYLDGTFLRARQATDPRDAKMAFALGFGAVFLVMILLTLGYAAVLEPGIGAYGGPGFTAAVAAALLPHFLLQSVFTMLVHCKAMPGGYPRGVLATTGFPILCIALFGVGLSLSGIVRYGLSLNEVVYRCFMAFYGLVFPAYVWICMIPTRDGHSGILGMRGRRKLGVLFAAIVLAMPFYWMGFIERETWYLAPGLGIVLLARLVVLGKRKLEPGEAGEGVARGGL